MINNMKYIYILEIDFEGKEIIITISDKLMWSMIPSSPEILMEYLHEYPDFDLVELDERFLRYQADRASIMKPN